MEHTYVALHHDSRETRLFTTLAAACVFITSRPNWEVKAFYDGGADDAGIRVVFTNAYGDLHPYTKN